MIDDDEEHQLKEVKDGSSKSSNTVEKHTDEDVLPSSGTLESEGDPYDKAGLISISCEFLGAMLKPPQKQIELAF